MGFRVLIVGGTGQVGLAVVRALLAASSCTEVVMVNRRTNLPVPISRTVNRYMLRHVSVGKDSQQWNEEDIRKLGIGLVGTFAHGCLAAGVERFGLLSAAGSSTRGWIRYARMTCEKEEAVRSLGFRRLTIRIRRK